MNELAIKVENLSKMYHIGTRKTADLRETLLSTWKKFFSENSKVEQSEFWALKDFSFELEQGKILGIIGKNGAGKSTALKILSRITTPTSGRITINGRIASLLEIGTGFHQDLTGRDNIFFNGSLLGMQKSEIKAKFDEIVAFSGIEKFIDTPVKRYSSGMYVRLAFAVAAHLEPEIMIIDEVLAVGDEEFQKKCLGKMRDVSSKGRTVIFVSHNMAAIKSLCNDAIYLKNGMKLKEGNASEVVEYYLSGGIDNLHSGIIPDDASLYFTGDAKLKTIQLQTEAGEITNKFYYKQRIIVNVNFEVFKDIKSAFLIAGVSTRDGIPVVYLESFESIPQALPLNEGQHQFIVDIPLNLLPGEYCINLGINNINGANIDYVERAIDFSVSSVAEDKDGHYRWKQSHGFVQNKAHWVVK